MSKKDDAIILLKRALELLSEECPHDNAINRSTMGDMVKKMYCPDCDDEWAEKIEGVESNG